MIDRPDACFRETVADILRLDSGTPARPTYAPVTMSTSHAAESPGSLLTLRQLLTEQGVAILGLILQPTLIYPRLACLTAHVNPPSASLH